MKQIAFFDFDGTVTTKDTLLEFIKFSKGTVPFYAGFLLNSPFLIAYKLKLISNQAAKERILSFFFRGMTTGEFTARCQAFASGALPGLLRYKALAEIQKLQNAGVEVVIVSASPENWIGYWAASTGAKLIATRLEIKDSRLTGKILGRNCHGNEKVTRIRELYKLTEYYVRAYGDTTGDKPMLRLGDESFYKPFR